MGRFRCPVCSRVYRSLPQHWEGLSKSVPEQDLEGKCIASNIFIILIFCELRPPGSHPGRCQARGCVRPITWRSHVCDGSQPGQVWPFQYDHCQVSKPSLMHVSIGLGDKTITICIAIDTWSISIKNVFDKTFDILYSSSEENRGCEASLVALTKALALW